MSSKRVCSVDQCNRPYRANGYCLFHRNRWYTYGDPLSGGPEMVYQHDADNPDRFWSKVDKSGECWIWLAGQQRAGYGSFGVGKNQGHIAAHIWSWEQANPGISRKGLEIDHLCSVPLCVKPDHLELVSHAENMRRVLERNRIKATHCPKGHEWTEQNTYVRKNAREGQRDCRACAREYQAHKRLEKE